MPHSTIAAPTRQELPPAERAKLAAMLALAEACANPAEPERLAATAAAERLLSKRGLRFRDLPALPAPEHREPMQGTWRATCAALMERQGNLRPWERGFVADLPRFWCLSSKQRYVLNEIAARVLGAGWQA